MHDAVRRGLLGLGLGVAALFLHAAPSMASEPYDIDVVLPLTGTASSLGTAEQVALEAEEKTFGAEGIGGRPVRFVFHDDQSSPQVAVQIANQIKGRNPAVVLGSATVAMCNAMAPVLKGGPVLYCLSPAIYPAPGSNVFSSSNATHDLLATQLRYLGSQGLRRVAFIASTDASGQDAQRQMKQLVELPENKDVQLVDQTSFNPTDVNVSAQVQHMKASQPQAIIVWCSGSPLGTVLKAIQDAGLDLPVVTSDSNMTYTAMSHFADVLPKQIYFPSPEWPHADRDDVPAAVRQAKDAFFGAFEGSAQKPDAASSFAWDPASLVVATLRKLGPEATGAQLRDALSKLTGFTGINGTYDFVKYPQRGLGDDNVIVARWDAAAGTWKAVSRPRGLPLE